MAPPPLGSELLTTADVAAYLRINRLTIHRWCKDGKLPAVKVGARYRVRRSDLEAWYEHKRNTLRASESPPEAMTGHF
jgi:excisionase family DNA binding protein